MIRYLFLLHDNLEKFIGYPIGFGFGHKSSLIRYTCYKFGLGSTPPSITMIVFRVECGPIKLTKLSDGNYKLSSPWKINKIIT